MKQDIELPEIEILAGEIHGLRLDIQELKQVLLPQKAWYSRQDLAGLKSVPVSAFYHHSDLLPPGDPSKQGGNDRWSYKQVWESGWIWMSDEDLRQKRKLRNVG